MKSKLTYEISLKFPSAQVGCTEMLKLVLVKMGLKAENIIEYAKLSNINLLMYFQNENKAQRIYLKLIELKLKAVKIALKIIKSQAWKSKGAETFKVFKLTRKLTVVPEKDRKKFNSKKERCIFLGNGLAFGSGLHETTRFMAQIIEENQGKFASFLDVGTGSGILTLVALKGGVGQVRAIDLSQDCIKVARNNLILNGFKPFGVSAINLNKLKSNKSYDFVAANLITKDLITHQNKILSLVSKGGYLALSGISLENYHLLMKSFRKISVKCLKVIKGKEWSAILFQRL